MIALPVVLRVGFSAIPVTWEVPARVPTSGSFIVLPAVAQESGGNNSIWLVWQQVNTSLIQSETDIFLKTYDPVSDSWTNDSEVNIDPAQGPVDDQNPSVAALVNGTMMILWSWKNGANFDLQYRLFNGEKGSVPVPLTGNPADEKSPAVVQSRDGRIWAVWERVVSAQDTDLYYKVYTEGVWSQETLLVDDPVLDRSPAILETKDGKIWIVWSANRTGDFQIYVRVFDGAWSPERQVVISGGRETNPQIIQDREGNIRIFFNREILDSTDIFHVISEDNGNTFSPPVALTSTVGIGEHWPAVLQAKDKRIWVFFSRTVTGDPMIDLYLQRSSQITPVHDISIRVSVPELVRYRDTLKINVSVANLGDFSETFQVVASLNGTTIGSENVALTPSASANITFPLVHDLSLWQSGRYVVKVDLSLILGETAPNRGDNTMILSVRLAFREDVFLDRCVDFVDFAHMAVAFGSIPGAPNWNPFADLTGDNLIDFFDINLVATLPPQGHYEVCL